MKKKNILISIIIVIVFIISIILISPSILNRNKASLSDIKPANSAFDDINFYNCVVGNYYYNSYDSDLIDYSEIYDIYNANINDPYFELLNLSEEKLNTYLSDEQLASITNLSCNNNVKSTKGLEKLVSLTELEIGDSEIVTLDLSDNVNLTSLSLSSNESLKSVDLSKNVNLSYLYVNDSEFTSLDLSKNVNLSQLDIYSNSKLETLDLSNNINLRSLTIKSNYRLKSLDLSENINLSYPSIRYNNLETIIMPKNYSSNFINGGLFEQYPYLTNIEVSDKKINLVSDDVKIYNDSIIIKSEMSKEDFENKLGLTNISIKLYDKSYTSTESTSDVVKGGMYVRFYDSKSNSISWNMEIKEFNNEVFEDPTLYQCVVDSYNRETRANYTTKNNLTDEEFSKITSLSCGNIFSIKGLEKLANLTSFYSYSDGRKVDFKIENISSLKKLKSLNISGYNIENIDLSVLESIESLSLYSNELVNVILPKTSTLTSVELSYNKLKSIDVTGLKQLQELMLDDNNLKEIKGLSDLSNLLSLSARGNKLKTIDVSGLTSLQELELEGNELVEINGITNLSNLYSLSASENKLKSIDVTGLKQLQALMLDFNNLEEIKGLSELTNMYGISVNFNKLKSLDLSKLSNLQFIRIYNNPCTISDISIIKGDQIEYNPAFKLPSSISLTKYNEYEDVINFNDNIITALEVGESTISSFIPDPSEYEDESYADLPIRYKVYVYDVLSSKYTVNKEHRYIYVGTEENDKAIRRYVKVYGEDANKKVEDNKFKLYRNEELIEKFDIIRLSSTKYDLSSSVISYKGNFDIDSIDVINAKLQVIEDQLQVMYDDVIVKTFTLKEEK